MEVRDHVEKDVAPNLLKDFDALFDRILTLENKEFLNSLQALHDANVSLDGEEFVKEVVNDAVFLANQYGLVDHACTVALDEVPNV